MRLTGVGLCLGLAGALVAGSLLATQLYQVRSADPLVALQTALVMGLVAFIACMMPAWSAARSNPIAALRNE
jgi:ABC-type antimicrobial peptide transport system permease subunit